MNFFEMVLWEMDVGTMRNSWPALFPHIPAPKDDTEALMVLHYARTVAEVMPLRSRAYSHRWLVERGHPSGLPDHLRPRAEQMCPVVRSAVGIAVLGTSELSREVAPFIRSAMSDAVEECYADGHPDAEIVRTRMLEARRKAMRQLLGRR